MYMGIIMFKIAICDDEQGFVDIEKRCIKDYLTKRNVEYRIDYFISGTSFLERFKKNDYNLVFLDVKLKSENGMEIAKTIHDTDPEIRVAFVSAYADYSVKGYYVNAIRFILKNKLFEEYMHECLEYVLSDMKCDRKREKFDFTTGTKELYLDYILYLDACGNYVMFVLNNQEDSIIYKVRGSLKKVNVHMREFGFEAISSHRSVNLKHVASLIGHEVIMDNGDRLVISQRKYTAFWKAYMLYSGRMIL